ncbi:MAG: GC-type dockerin domain-anchored protein [Phycisphaerales bacterium]
MLKAIALGSICVLGSAAFAGSTGPDVIVGGILEAQHYGPYQGIHAYAIGTDACNIGDEPANWIQFSNEHPVIAQNIYRIVNGRIEQIGQSWLKHSFQALAGGTCGSCQNPGTGSLLGVGCSDPYGANYNGSQDNLGPRSEVNAWTGVFSWPFVPAGATNPVNGRIQVREEDLTNPSFSTFILEAQYVTHDDAVAGNQNNNASWRRAQFDPDTFALTPTGATAREEPAILAWAAFDGGVDVVSIDVPGEGRFNLGARAHLIDTNTWRYEYALHNQNSYRCASGFVVPIPGSFVDTFFFHDIDCHSGEPYSNVDWPASPGPTSVAWRTEPFDINPNANAIRWGTLYNFGFISHQPPTTGEVTIELFRPGTPSSLRVTTIVPASPSCSSADLAEPFGSIDFSDVVAFLTAFAEGDPAADLAPPFGQLDFSDVVAYLVAFSAGCP